MISGFRLHYGGFWELAGVTPDLVTLGEWREYAGGNSGQTLNEYEPGKPITGLRFRLTYDSMNGSVNIVVKRVSVFFTE